MLGTLAPSFRPDNALARMQQRPASNARLDRGLLLQVLDEVDYGLLLVDASGQILHANHLARHELASALVVQASASRLLAACAGQNEALSQAIERACQGHRVLLDLGRGSQQLSVAFVPMTHPMEEERGITLVLFGKRDVCQALTMRHFARSHGLTPAEEQVLSEICTGEKVARIAHRLGVAVATVRTQLSSIRRKTRTATVPKLIKLVALLPPLVPPLRLG